MSKRNRKKKQNQFYTDNFWESAAYNQRAYLKNFDMLLALAMNRFRWTGLPETCDARFFERALHRNGIATMAFQASDATRSLLTLEAAPNGEYNMYGIPTRWRAIGFDGRTQFNVSKNMGNGELCYYSYSRISPWNALEIYARKMAHYERTEDVNLTQQMRPFIGIAPQEKQLELVNLIKQAQGGEPAILGDNGLGELVKNVTVLDTKVPIITEELAKGAQNVLNQALLYLGIPHLAFEKGERMIEDEARANTAPTNVMLLDCLNARRQFCEKVNSRFGLDVKVFFNDDFESYNFNYVNNIESQAQDKLIMSTDGTISNMSLEGAING